VAQELLRTLLAGLEVFRIGLTRPGFDNFVALFTGWVLTMGPHAVTQALVTTGVAGLFQKIERFIPAGAIRIAMDDTLAPKKGPHVFGIGSHLDAVRSTRAYPYDRSDERFALLLRCFPHEVHLLVFQRAPQPFDEDVVTPADLAVHADLRAAFLEPVDESSPVNCEPWSVLKISGVPYRRSECRRMQPHWIVPLHPCG